jgi:DNA-binding XRE family transcriptional regulator
MNIKKSSSRRLLVPLLEEDVGPLTFGMFLRVSRERLGFSQTELAKRLTIARGTLCDIEKGRQLVSPELAVSMAKKLGLSNVVALRACFQDQVNRLKMDLKVKLVA